MIQPAGPVAQSAKMAELKRLILTKRREPIEALEDAVDAFLWEEEETGKEANSNETGLNSSVKPK